MINDASRHTYSPNDPADWPSPPGLVDEALDNVASEIKDHIRLFFNGSFIETFDARVTSDGSIITMTLEQTGGGDLTMAFSDGYTSLDCTPACSIALTAGSDSSPQANYVYILLSTKVLTLSTTAWPTAEHIKVAYFFCQSAASMQTAGGPIINQNWNDHRVSTDGMGHMAHIAEKSRRLGSTYFSGVDGNGTDGYLTPTAGVTELKATSGVIWQLHRQSFPAFDTSGTDTVHVKNWSGDAYHAITDLFDITDDSTGTTIGNNKFFNLIIWGVINKTDEHQTMMINLPAGFYNTQSDAENDVSGYDDFTMPREFNIDSSTGFLIARVTVQMGGTWSVSSTVDLRGTTPQTASGGAAGVATSFADNAFNVFDSDDITRLTAIDSGSITTGNTRTITMADKNIDLGTLLDDSDFASNGLMTRTADGVYSITQATTQTIVWNLSVATASGTTFLRHGATTGTGEDGKAFHVQYDCSIVAMWMSLDVTAWSSGNWYPRVRYTTTPGSGWGYLFSGTQKVLSGTVNNSVVTETYTPGTHTLAAGDVCNLVRTVTGTATTDEHVGMLLFQLDTPIT